jgi:hypothetical protein
VSALGHFIEEEGIATVAIGLIRPQIENTKPPRALWVPFELGRPFGPPGDSGFQKQVIGAALQMLVEGGGPVRIADFAQDDPRERPDPDWRPPVTEPSAEAADAALAGPVKTEVARLAQAYDRALKARGRTTVGLSGLSVTEAAHYLARWLDGEMPESPVADMSPPLALRFAIDDLKAYYLEAALSPGSRPSSRQQSEWLWRQTALGRALFALRRTHMEAADERLKLIAGNFTVPGRVLAAA